MTRHLNYRDMRNPIPSLILMKEQFVSLQDFNYELINPICEMDSSDILWYDRSGSDCIGRYRPSYGKLWHVCTESWVTPYEMPYKDRIGRWGRVTGDRDYPCALHWRHNYHDDVSNHQPYSCLLNRLFRRRSKKTSKLRVTGLCVRNSAGPVTSPHKGPVTRKMFPFDDVIMELVGFLHNNHLIPMVMTFEYHPYDRNVNIDLTLTSTVTVQILANIT